MSENKTPNAVVVSAQRLQDLRDLCQPSNFNTAEQAHSALHDGISKLLNERTGIYVSPRRLNVGDRFTLCHLSKEVWVVGSRLRKTEIKMTTASDNNKITMDLAEAGYEFVLVKNETTQETRRIYLGSKLTMQIIGDAEIPYSVIENVYLITPL